MFGVGNDSFQQSRQLFEDQFEADGDGFLYRRSQKGAPVRVTADERSRFVSEYMTRTKRGVWIGVTLTMLTIGGFVWWTLGTDVEFEGGPIWALTAVLILAIGSYSLWNWGAPARELANRTPVGRERSSAEVSQRFLQNMTYGQLAATAFAGIMLPFALRGKHDFFQGWDRLWLVMSGGIVLVAVIQAFRKWLIERGQGNSGS